MSQTVRTRLSALLIAFACLLAPRNSLSPTSAAEGDAAAGLPERAYAILKQRCYQCHGVDFNEPGLDVLDRTTLVADRGERKTRFLTPGKLAESKIWIAVESGSMPIGGTRLPNEELALLKQWIESGAEFPLAKLDERPFFSYAAIDQAIHDHLRKATREDRPFLRYLSLAHLHNRRSLSNQDLRYARAALSKALNSLSRDSEIALPKPIDPHETVFVIDLRRYGWTAAQWKKVVEAYPYGLEPRPPAESDVFKEIEDLFDVNFDGVTHVRGDWFAVTATRPPLYHEMLGLPDTLAAFEKEIGVDRVRDFNENRLFRGGVQTSGVSTQNRVMDVHSSTRGLYWISYDFFQNSGRGNLTRFPLGPDFQGNRFSTKAFQQAGSEIVFTLPNRLFGYLLVDNVGKRIDVGPVSIVHDPAKNSGSPEIVNGISCIACHKHGLRDFIDVLGPSNGLQNADERRKAQQLFNAKEMQTRLVQHRSEFLRALDTAAGPFLKKGDDVERPIEQFPEPISFVARLYDRDLNLETAAAELGIENPATLKANLGVSVLRSLGMGPLDQGQTIKRTMWAAREGQKSPYQEAAQALDIGTGVSP